MLLILYFDWVVIGRPTFLFRDSFASFHTHATILTFFVCVSVLFHSCCSHARVVGKTLVHEFPISYSHTEWYYIFALIGAIQTKHAPWTLLQALFLKWSLNLFNSKIINCSVQ